MSVVEELNIARRANLQLKKEIEALQRENAELKKSLARAYDPTSMSKEEEAFWNLVEEEC